MMLRRERARALLACVLVAILASCAPSRGVGASAPASRASASPSGESCAGGQAKRCRDEAASRAAAGDLAGALALRKKGCDLGDEAACFDLAIAVHDGKGTTADVAAGRKLFADGCQRGHADSCATLATLLKQAHENERATELRERACGLGQQRACNDIGVELVDAPNPSRRDPARARQLFERACDAGVPAGCSNLAFVLAPKEGDSEAEGRALALFVRACEGKNPAGCREVGVRHIKGEGLPKDETAASAEFEIACGGDDPAGCDWLAYTQEHGLGRPTDTQRAMANYGKACDKSNYDGCYHLGSAYAAGRNVEKDAKHAGDLFDTACGGGISQACYSLANLEVPGDAAGGEGRLEQLCKKEKTKACAVLGSRLAWRPSTRARGIELLRGACEKGDSDACERGLFTAEGTVKGSKPNPELVYFFAERSCKAASGCGKLAGLVLRGSGTKADPKRAAELAETSCDKKDGQGCLVAAKIYQQGKGVARDAKKAYGFLERGCEHYTPEACDGQARALRRGDGVDRDVARAKEIEERARDLRED
jgi:TPR repeat protein